jgi:hypothetical protein
MNIREDFEKWAEENLGLSARKSPSGEYQSFGMYTAWLGWQASRVSQVIDLPKPLPSGDYRMTVPFYKAADVIEALSAAGIEVKA